MLEMFVQDPHHNHTKCFLGKEWERQIQKTRVLGGTFKQLEAVH